jgi:hypothetical protein
MVVLDGRIAPAPMNLIGDQLYDLIMQPLPASIQLVRHDYLSEKKCVG